jgi:hypothetical protein
MSMTKRLCLSILAVGLVAGCSQQQSSNATPRTEEKVVHLTPAKSALKVSFLTAELADMRVIERTNAETGEVTYGPRFLATLKLRNPAEDETARLVGGELSYLDREGRPIKLAEGRGEPAFTFPSWSGDRLDPGDDLSTSIDVPFPASAVKGTALSEVRVHLSFVPSPYREAAATFTVSRTP